ncbi:MAG: GTP-binding protein, partial [Chloroflexi bacterium]
MGNTYKVVVTGIFNVGKTEFIRTISDIPIVTTEKRITDHRASTKEETTVAMDYGQVRLNGDLFHLYGTPGQSRFDFMWDILSTEMHAFILLVDSCNLEGLLETKQLIRVFQRRGRMPYLVVANKQDRDEALSPEEIGKRLGLDEENPVLPCVATDKSSVLNVLRKL